MENKQVLLYGSGIPDALRWLHSDTEGKDDEEKLLDADEA